MKKARVVVIGGGFGGLNVARGLRRAAVDVTLIDRRNFHLFQPLLYQVATGGLSPANIAAPLRSLLRRQKNTRVVMGDVQSVDFTEQTVHTDSSSFPFDYLVIAAGARHSYFGHSEWEPIAPGLKTIEDATDIRARILSAFEMAERETEQAKVAPLLTFVIAGGGPTGVELAGAIAELARQTLKKDFRTIDPESTRVLLVDAGPRILLGFPPKLSARAMADLTRLGVEVRVDTKVNGLEPGIVTLVNANGSTEIVHAQTVLWAAGVQAERLAKQIATVAGLSVDRAGRLPVQPDLTLAGFPNVFAIGDIAHCPDSSGKPLPGVAPVAMQQGKFVARTISRRLSSSSSVTANESFKFINPGNLATIGRRAAVAELGRFQFSGYFAWMLWAIVHVLQISMMESRILVFFQWAWNYITFNRSARLITTLPRESPVPRPDRPSSDSVSVQGRE